jgi:hypothetical protein
MLTDRKLSGVLVELSEMEGFCLVTGKLQVAGPLEKSDREGGVSHGTQNRLNRGR